MADRAANDELVPLLGGVGLFSQCDDYELKVIARRAELRDVPEGANIITQGDETDELFVLLTGGAVAVVDGEERNRFGPGDHFGELAALARAPRTSDVRATEPSTVAVLTRNKLYSLFDSVPGVARSMIESLATSVRNRITSP